MSVPKDYEEFFALLNREKARYLVVGAYALAFHGRPRFTGDIDVFVAISETNAERLLKALEGFGYADMGIRIEDFLHKDRSTQLGFPPLRIDILTSIDGLQFQDAWSLRARGGFGKQRVWYISKGDLIRNKRAAGRPQDALDLELLGELKKKRKS